MYRFRSARIARVLTLSPLHCAVVAALGAAAPASAQFQPLNQATINGTVNAAQTLSNATGTISLTGAIIINSGGAVPLTMSNTSTLVNNGTVQTLGGGRAIDSNTAGSSLAVTNNGLVSSVSADAFAVRQGNSSVSLLNSGTIQVTNGGQAIDWANITTGTNTLTNQATGKITAMGEDAVRPGTNGVVINAGTITAAPTGTTDPSGSDGIDLRTLSGIQVTNTGTISGRHGIATDGSNTGPSTLTVTNNAAGVIMAINGSGINVDGVSATVTATVTNQVGATIKGGASMGALVSDGDGIDVDGVLTLTNSGQVLGLGARGAGNNAEGVAAGGGKIINNATGVISGDGLGLGGAGNGILIDNSNGGAAVAQTTIDNSGLIEGKSGFAIKMIGALENAVVNNAGGTIRGTGATAGAALQTGDGKDAVINKGAIVGGNGSALDLQGGDDKLTIEGGAASITGSVSGGAGKNAIVFDLGLGNSFSHSDKLSMFDTVEAKSGVATIHGHDQIDPASKLVLSGGILGVADAGGANGQTFASLILSDNSGIDLNGSTSLTFSDLGVITAGKHLSIVGYDGADSPDYAIRFLGNLTTDPDFLALMSMTTVNGRVALFNFDGTFTNVTVPEPSTLAVMGLGLALLGFRGLRRRRTVMAKG